MSAAVRKYAVSIFRARTGADRPAGPPRPFHFSENASKGSLPWPASAAPPLPRPGAAYANPTAGAREPPPGALTAHAPPPKNGNV